MMMHSYMLARALKKIKKKTGWSWEKLNRELIIAMGEDGPSHTTLYRIATGRLTRHHNTTLRYVSEALHKLIETPGQKI